MFVPLLFRTEQPCILIDEECVGDELREQVIGMTEDWRVLRVIYTFREEVIRIISARTATPAERRAYEEA
ncbi:MAG TPA: hypothetical protein G4N96_00040 [Chloroflexi bacterium]|nr:MAG: hypothetical protein B6243_07570 [Anaerolineaceae bacterium 4572_5.2]HEY83490.1 hypothetical protein [Chloroflexota bacterium]